MNNKGKEMKDFDVGSLEYWKNKRDGEIFRWKMVIL